jgi:hypothetical protein
MEAKRLERTCVAPWKSGASEPRKAAKSAQASAPVVASRVQALKYLMSLGIRTSSIHLKA